MRRLAIAAVLGLALQSAAPAIAAPALPDRPEAVRPRLTWAPSGPGVIVLASVHVGQRGPWHVARVHKAPSAAPATGQLFFPTGKNLIFVAALF